jgi:hypothetical protein
MVDRQQPKKRRRGVQPLGPLIRTRVTDMCEVKSWSLVYFAELCNISENTLFNIFSGKRVDRGTIDKIAYLLDEEALDLIDGGDLRYPRRYRIESFEIDDALIPQGKDINTAIAAAICDPGSGLPPLGSDAGPGSIRVRLKLPFNFPRGIAKTLLIQALNVQWPVTSIPSPLLEARWQTTIKFRPKATRWLAARNVQTQDQADILDDAAILFVLNAGDADEPGLSISYGECLVRTWNRYLRSKAKSRPLGSLDAPSLARMSSSEDDIPTPVVWDEIIRRIPIQLQPLAVAFVQSDPDKYPRDSLLARHLRTTTTKLAEMKKHLRIILQAMLQQPTD